MGTIYKITNIVNNKVYIGQTRRDPMARFQEHLTSASIHDNTVLQHAINKYGKDNFKIDIIETCPDDLLNIKEKYWINQYQSLLNQYGYNMTEGGETSSENLKREVYQFSLSGKLIKRFSSIADASRELGGEKHTSGICNACNGKIKQYLGFLWGYNQTIESQDLSGAKRWKYYKIDIYNKEDKLIAQDLTISQVKIFLNIKTISSIYNALYKMTKVGNYECKDIDNENQKIVLVEANKKAVRKTRKRVATRSHNIQVAQYSLDDKCLHIYNSITEAENAVGGSNKGHIGQVCSGKRKSAYGYKWKYVQVN